MKHRPMSLTTMLVTGLVGTVMLIMACSITLFTQTYQKMLIRNTETASRQTVSQVGAIVRDYLDNINDTVDLISRELSEPGQDRDEFLEDLLKIRPDIVALTSYDEQGNLVDSKSLGREVRKDLPVNLSFSLEEAQARKRYISTPHVVSLFEGYYPWTVSVVAPANTKYGEKWVSMDIRFRDIATYINGVGIGRHGYCFLMDSEGNIIYHPQQQLLYSNLKQENTELIAGLSDGSHLEKNVIYSIRTVSHRGWRVIGVSFVDEMLRAGAQDISDILSVTGVTILMMSLIMSVLLSQVLSRPIHNLTEAMGEFEKDADGFTYTPVSGIQEVSSLSASFSHLVGRIQELMEKVRKEEVNLRKTELRALQAQINPHFLYNTLDSIAWMCERGKNKDAVEMVNALAKLFRISISRGHELIPIRSELQHAESYLKIQAHRYRDQFTYEFRAEEDCLDYLCNKITLQPIIENAIYHGINGLVDEGLITISVSSEGENILFAVEDNGNGMEPEQVAAILQKERSDHAGIGIKNVNDRLKIYFGAQYGITIHSVPDEGTRVEIRMPKVREEAEYEKK